MSSKDLAAASYELKLDALAATNLVCSRVAAGDERRQLAAGDSLHFGLILLGNAIEYLPYAVFAVSEMARGGIGAGRAPFKLDVFNRCRDAGSNLESRETRSVGMSFWSFVRNLLRRGAMLAAVREGPVGLGLPRVELACQVSTRESSLEWLDWDRYSNGTTDRTGGARVYRRNRVRG
jgi:hypothetical protein